jgi:hypothetical protein
MASVGESVIRELHGQQIRDFLAIASGDYRLTLRERLSSRTLFHIAIDLILPFAIVAIAGRAAIPHFMQYSLFAVAFVWLIAAVVHAADALAFCIRITKDGIRRQSLLAFRTWQRSLDELRALRFIRDGEEQYVEIVDVSGESKRTELPDALVARVQQSPVTQPPQ